MKNQFLTHWNFLQPAPRILGRLTAPVLLFLWTFLVFQRADAQNASSMAQVQTVFARRAAGNAFFNRSLRSALQERGLRFTQSIQNADALLDTSGRWLKSGGFVGEMTFIGRGGKILQREKVVRPANSNVMTYRSLSQKMRFKARN